MIDQYLEQIVLPKQDSTKGDNGRVLVIGGSRLFHAASFWAASMASKIVDMVHFASPASENDELMRIRAKAGFWEGIVVPWEEVEHYIDEDDVILIGPGMERGSETKKLVNELLSNYLDKKWVVDGGALQEVDPNLLTASMIVTPNKREQEILLTKIANNQTPITKQITITELSKKLDRVAILAKGVVDIVSNGVETINISGGSPGMTKGGTGDVLSGIVAGLYAKSPAVASCVVASHANKQAGEMLAKKVGPFFSANDLIAQVQVELAEIVSI